MTDTSELKTLNRLWEVAEQIGRDLGYEENPLHNGIESTGIYLERPVFQYDYWCTPTNAVTFATTGNDGVHFNLLRLDGELKEESPVVMTVPMCLSDEPNFIVGESLYDYLCLGCRSTFDHQELAFDPEAQLKFLENPEVGLVTGRSVLIEPQPEPPYALQVLTRELNLRPWPEIPNRLAELKAKYLPLLELPEDE